jgi:hypothetical protein
MLQPAIQFVRLVWGQPLRVCLAMQMPPSLEAFAKKICIIKSNLLPPSSVITLRKEEMNNWPNRYLLF